MVVKIPKTYRSKILELDIGEPELLKVEVRGYRPADIDLVVEIEDIRREIPKLTSKLKVFQKIKDKVTAKAKKSRKQVSEKELQEKIKKEFREAKDSDYSEEEIQEILDGTKEINKINSQLNKVTAILGQRGAKRFYYRDEKEFREAENNNTLTEYIDSLPDIEFDIDNLRNIAFTMLDLSSPSKELEEKLDKKAKEDDKGK